jgi:hypothetical protein
MLIFVAMLGAITLLGGCEKQLFPESAARTPYDRYQMLRGQSRMASETNAYGGDQPALRDRLRPLDQQ